MANPEWKCNNCNNSFSASRFADHCPKCNSYDISAKKGSGKKTIFVMVGILGALLIAVLVWFFIEDSNNTDIPSKPFVVSTLFQEKNLLKFQLVNADGEEGPPASLVEKVVLNNSTQTLAHDGDEIYPCKSNDDRLALLFISKDQTLFRDTIVSVPFSLDGEKQHNKALCKNDQVAKSPDDTKEGSTCPKPSDIKIEYNYSDCTFSVGLKKPFDRMQYTVFLNDQKIEANGLDLRSINTWNIKVQVESELCSGTPLVYFKNGDKPNISGCPRVYDQKEVDGIKQLLASWLNDPTSKAKMDQCEARLTSVFGDKGYTIKLDGLSIDTYASLREQIDNETLNNEKVQYILAGFRVDNDPYRLTSIEVKTK